MSRAIIEARGIGKSYRLGGLVGGYKTLRESLVSAAKASVGWLKSGSRRASAEPFWALRDVSFEVTPGEAVGIIGRNGAGKSTLLKILSRITAPTTGELRLRGRVASLLEVGTGFHPELTGRENIFVNGAIMGMTRSEVRARFDEIVAFAEIDQFLDTPVKRYSSGMYVRLAFAVAAHLRPEILVVDEVLAVGDLSFQKKCLGKMEMVASGGRTVLFVSHNMAAITRLCRRAILLEAGKVVADASAPSVVARYVGAGGGDSPVSVVFGARAPHPAQEAVLVSGRVTSARLDGACVDIRDPITIELEYQILRSAHAVHPNVHLYNEEGTCVFVTTDTSRPSGALRPPGRYRARVVIPGNLLAEGVFSLDLALSTLDPVIVHDWDRGALSFQVTDPAEGDSARGNYGGPVPGVVRPALPWTIDPCGAAE